MPLQNTGMMPPRDKAMKLEDRVAIVTGAGVGIGAAYSKRFAKEGARVVCADIDGENAERTAKEISELGGHAIGVKTDVAKKDNTDAMAQRAKDHYGRIDILVNNAAMFTALPEGPFDQLTEENWDRCMEVNLKGLWNCIRSVFPYMKEQHYGKVINVSSITWLLGRPYRLDYVTSKAGIVGLTHAIAPELGACGINVNSVLPGLIQNESTLKVYEPEYFQKYSERQALKRSLKSEDVCGAVVFLASDDSEMITGQSIVVDGGLVFH
ncbi:glucose 1-dehydrogenase [Acidobacteria bacterium AH-259-D05]|nr:glucose 1-dehydrogenase [Acidobacteria bacterium AH-259-D05]